MKLSAPFRDSTFHFVIVISTRSHESRNSHPTTKKTQSHNPSATRSKHDPLEKEEHDEVGVLKNSKPEGEWWLSSKTVSSKTIRYWISDEINNRDDVISQFKNESGRYKERISSLENKYKIKSVDADLKIKDLEQQLENVTIDSEMQLDGLKKEMNICELMCSS